MTSDDIERIPATMENVQRLRGLYGYAVLGDTADGECDVEFPSVYAAASFRETMRGMWPVELLSNSMITDFDAPVTLVITLDGSDASAGHMCSQTVEVGLSDCEFGCKIYRCPHVPDRVLHNATYGCRTLNY